MFVMTDKASNIVLPTPVTTDIFEPRPAVGDHEEFVAFNQLVKVGVVTSTP
jgi:hypothetical protein